MREYSNAIKLPKSYPPLLIGLASGIITALNSMSNGYMTNGGSNEMIYCNIGATQT